MFFIKVRKLIQKVCKREIFRYRKITDRPVDAEKVQKSDSKINIEELAAGIVIFYFILFFKQIVFILYRVHLYLNLLKE